jgi:hypothetical protein
MSTLSHLLRTTWLWAVRISEIAIREPLILIGTQTDRLNPTFLRIPWNDSCTSRLITEQHKSTWTLFCQTSAGEHDFLVVRAGGGGPSQCATGTPSTPGTVSGNCQGWPRPSWQAGFADTRYGKDVEGRGVPDLSLFAASGSAWGHAYAYCWSDSLRGGTAPCTPNTLPGYGYGTSASAPAMAGIQSLARACTHKQRQGAAKISWK